MRDKSRDLDLEKLNQKRNDTKTVEDQKHIEALMVSVFEQSKDPILTNLRGDIIGALKDLEEKGDDEERWMRYVAAVARVEKYVSSYSFRSNIATKISQTVNDREASRFYVGEEVKNNDR